MIAKLRLPQQFKWHEFLVEEFGQKDKAGRLLTIDKYIVRLPDGSHIYEISTQIGLNAMTLKETRQFVEFYRRRPGPIPSCSSTKHDGRRSGFCPSSTVSSGKMGRDGGMSKGQRRLLLEGEVNEQIGPWLNMIPGMWINRANVGGAKFQNKEGGKTYFVKFGVRGQADWTGIYRTHVGARPFGIRVEIETKKEGETLTGKTEHEIEQQGWLDNNARYGAISFWCNSLDDCARKLKKAFEEKGLPWASSWDPQ